MRMDADRLAVLDLRFETGGAEIQLTVQAGGRLIGDEMEWETQICGHRGRQPGRMSRAVGVIESRNLRGRDLDPAARGRQGRRHGVAAERPHDSAIPGQGRQCQFADFPELVEIGSLCPTVQQSPARRLIEMLQPLVCRAAFGKSLGNAEALGYPRKDVVIVAGLGIGGHRPVHCDQQRIAR